MFDTRFWNTHFECIVWNGLCIHSQWTEARSSQMKFPVYTIQPYLWDKIYTQ